MPTLLAYLVAFLFLKLAGRRGVRQLSLFEQVIILPWARPPEDVPLLGIVLAMAIFYRASTTPMATSRVPA